MATIYDRGGTKLSDATLRVNPTTSMLEIAPCGQSGALLLYYFGRGEREVVIDTGDAYLRGQIETRWEGDGRRWLMRDVGSLAASWTAPSCYAVSA